MMESETQDSPEDPLDYISKRKKSTTTVEAAKIYVLMPNNIPVSRAARLQWLLDNLNTVVPIPSCAEPYSNDDLQIISVIPAEETGATHCLITANTQVEFLAQSYRFVYCLDMSPSQTSVDIHLDEILFDEIITSFKTSLLALCEKFTIPGNVHVFQPCIYLTVIVNTPFFISPAQQVLVKGVQISSQNVHDIIYSVQTQFHYIEGRIAHMSDLAYDQIDKHMQENEDFIDGVFDVLEPPQYTSNIPVVSSDANFVNMLRYSMLAVSLLPANSLSNIVIITDGVVAMPDSNIMESILFQLHYDSIALSFLKVGSDFNPQVSAGYVSYSDLLQFLSCSTLGTYLETLPVINNTKSMNMYQQLYLLWSFNSKIQFNSQMIHHKPILSRVNLYCNGIPPLLSKKQAENDVKVPLHFLLYRRMREGYSVSRISLSNGFLEVILCLHWKAYIYIQYILRTQWPLVSNITHYEIYITAPYDFLHDITCLMKKETKSTYRQAVFEKFWLHLIQLANTNDVMSHLSSFQTSCIWYNIPESTKSGIPLFVINETSSYDTNKIVLTVNDKSCPKFAAIWQPICQVETNNWRKWFHVHKISCILKHDSPLLKSIHLVNASGRYEVIQCRQAVNALYEFLSKWSSFTLIDNHTYLKLLDINGDRPPLFCIIRVTSKLPCTTINVGFVTGTNGKIRHKVINELKLELSNLSYLSNSLKSKENCCTILRKPLEKICIRYERVPSEFHTVIFPDGTQPPHSSQGLPVSPLAGTLFTTLSRYLFHQRWVWSANHATNPKLELKAISRILTTMTGMRLKEGFSLAHSASGIITMVLELPMHPALSCIVQYVLFPPHDALAGEDSHSISEDEQEQDVDTELQIVTEVWIEPQYGTVAETQVPQIKYMEDKYYYQLSEKIRLSDFNCVNSLLTLEHLSLMCQPKTNDVPIEKLNDFKTHKFTPKTCKNTVENNSSKEDTESVWIPILVQRIQHIPFNFNPISILNLCQQTELLFSMFMEESAMHLSDMEKSNILLLDNIYTDLLCIHDRELEISASDCVQFMEQVIERHKDKLHDCPITALNLEENPVSEDTVVRWRCFLKGISTTHVILTFIPASLKDTQNFILNKPTLSKSASDASIASRSTNSDLYNNDAKSSCSLPIFVYDCTLAVLVEACINSYNNTLIYSKDIFDDHRFKIEDHVTEEKISLKPEENPDDKGENDSTDRSAKNHCKTLILTHCKCFATSLFSALHQDLYVHSSDVQAAMDQCEETVYEIDITEYLQTVCGHLKQHKNTVEVTHLQNSKPCQTLKPMHRLIKDKFLAITREAFSAIPTNEEFYYCHNVNFDKIDTKTMDSDDETSNSPSDVIDFKSDSNLSGYICFNKSGSMNLSQICPLFLNYICTVRYGDNDWNMSVKVLPTCLGELIPALDSNVDNIDLTNLQVTLDVLCLTLPVDVQNVINGYSAKGLRTTSFCSDGFQTSMSGSTSEISYNSAFNLDLRDNGCLTCLPDVQRRAINVLIEEIKWLLQDEIATSLLDIEPVTINTLKFISKHISDSTSRKSCVLDIIDLNFVYEPNQSYKIFVQEFSRITIPEYKLCNVEDLYYLSKNTDDNCGSILLSEDDLISENDDNDLRDHGENYSQTTSLLGMDGECDDSSCVDEKEDFKWLLELHEKRQNLPNFWLIAEIHNNSVMIYFHCRFLELQTTHVGMYLKVQRAMCDAIKDLCKHVNQYLLLQSLHNTGTCNILLEPDDTYNDWQNDTNASTVSKPYSRLKIMDEVTDESESYPAALMEATLKFKPGYFSCPVVWETHFILHPRLKTGPGKSGLSNGIMALQKVLDKFCVSNRNNMFVYQDSDLNVFYLRLHENLNYYSKGLHLKANGFENVSRSPSVASLPLGHPHSVQPSTDTNAITNSMADIRPRVQSVSEKESKEDPQEDTIILKVHGITETGKDIKCDLVQVLQNRLDDTVLEILSVMLARNAMCPLTSEDVRFLQKPFKQPEHIIRLTIQDFAVKVLPSFTYYLRQNLLQFLNIPKYTDNKSHYHFKDYTECDNLNKITEDNIFIYNQSQSPTSGSRGISCIALAIVDNAKEVSNPQAVNFDFIYQNNSHADVVKCNILKSTDKLPGNYLEFRLWNQGRVNVENLSQKLSASASHAHWDIIIEYYLLINPLCIENKAVTTLVSKKNKVSSTTSNSSEQHRKTILDSGLQQSNMTPRIINYELKFDRISAYLYRKTVAEHFSPQKFLPLVTVDSFEAGDEGILSNVYSLKLPDWLEFAVSFNVPAVKKYKINLNYQHSLNTAVKELQSVITQLSQDSVKTFVLDEKKYIHVPFNTTKNSNECILIARNFEHWKISVGQDASISVGEFLNGNVLKHILKFVPTAVGDKLIPRQKILWANINCNEIIIYTYNWSKDNMDKLIEQGGNLGLWLTLRGALLSSITAQKLGLFHDQVISRKSFHTLNNPYVSLITDVDCMAKFPKERTRRSSLNALMSIPPLLDVFKDTYRIITPHVDTTITNMLEMCDIKQSEKRLKDELKSLYSMYQSRSSTATAHQIQVLMQNSRNIHYCHTPLLFLSRWRLQAASTRDHTVTSNDVEPEEENAKDESWHKDLCTYFILEYKHYLQTLGFMPLQIDNVNEKNHTLDGMHFMLKALLGGILIFTIELREPFLITKLHAIEYNRLHANNTRAAINQFMQSFLDECDKVKFFMHLHSFTYDFHLRCVCNYISNNNNSRLKEGYYITNFLDDFMKYYSKAPNYARNLVHTDDVVIADLLMEGKELYNYLLTYIRQYNFKFIGMCDDDNMGEETEYILVQTTNIPQLSYKDSQDRQHTDDFDVTLIVTNRSSHEDHSRFSLHLKYYLILTSRSEIYPKYDVERKLGKFRTVTSLGKSLQSESEKPKEIRLRILTDCNISDEKQLFNDAETSSRLSSDFEKVLNNNTEDEISDDSTNSESDGDRINLDALERKPSCTRTHVEIKQESVNYLGYYSSHEQLMQQLILECAKSTQKRLTEMANQGTIHCRTHILWNKLLSTQEHNQLCFVEFTELKSLARLKNLSEIHPNLGLLLNQPLSWYQDLAKLLLNKYSDQYRLYVSPDGNIQYYVILHPRYAGAFMLLSLDLYRSRGDLFAAYRPLQDYEDSDLCMRDREALINGFINCVCFYLWMNMI